MSNRKKIAYFTSRIPYPLEKGDKLRAYHQIKQLSKNNDIVLCVVSDKQLTKEAEIELKKYVQEIYVYHFSKLSILTNLLFAWISGFPFQVGYFFNSGAHFFFNKVIEKEQPDLIFTQLIRMAEYAKNIGKIPKYLDYMDTLSKGMQRRMERSKGIRKLVFNMEYNRLKKYEEKVFHYFDKCFVITEQDQKDFAFEKAKEIIVIPNGVDDEFFSPNNSAIKEYDIVFTGNMSYPPNIKAARYIVKEILPILEKDITNFKVMLAGANPHPQVRELANNNVTVTGWIDDIRDAYSKAKLFVAPLQIGTGLQNKLLEAICMEIPCITSTLANNALGAKEGKEIHIANTPEEYANKIKYCLNNKNETREVVSNAKQFITNNYNWESIVSKMDSIMQ